MYLNIPGKNEDCTVRQVAPDAKDAEGKPHVESAIRISEKETTAREIRENLAEREGHVPLAAPQLAGAHRG